MTLADHPFVNSHVGNPAILDANILLFQWCIEFDETLIRKFKRIATFEIEDAVLPSELLPLFGPLRTTPHVLTEVSNLSNSLASWVKRSWFEFFAEKVEVVPETYTPSSQIVQDDAAIQFGLTDAALTELARTHVILTIDWPLTNSIQSRGLSVINFNNLREALLYS